MPCIFCLAVFLVVAGALTTVMLDQMESQLASVAGAPVSRPVNSDSVAVFETEVEIPRTFGHRSIPVRVTVYKKYKRVRIQVLTHDLTRAEAEAVEDLIAQALQLRIVDRSDAHDEAKVREAFGDEAEADLQQSQPAEAQTEQAEVQSPEPEAASTETPKPR
jgi:hypothetical protein